MGRKVLIINGNMAYESMFRSEGYEPVKKLIEADLVCFTGGADVNPELYGQKKHPETHFSEERDKEEVEIYEQAFDMGIPCVGICRGAQFLHVMNGGELYQHVDGHTAEHKTRIIGYGDFVKVSSTHHQQIKPNLNREDFLVLMENPTITKNKWIKYGRAAVNLRYTHDGGHDIEACFYSDSECLCFQPHPEFEGYEECTNAFFHFIDNHIFEEENPNRGSRKGLKTA